MVRKKVLIITYYWPPSGGSGVQRWVKFCKYLPDFDIEPIVLTVKNGTYPLLDETLSNQVDDSLEVHYSKGIEPYTIYGKLTGRTNKEVSTPATAFSTDGGIIQKLGVWLRSNFFIPDARIGWIPNTLAKAKKIIEENSIDIVITTGPPNSTHMVGTKLKSWKSGLRWIMDMRDPWSQIFYNQNLPRTSLAKKIDLKFEKKALQSADEVIVVSNGMKKLQSSISNRDYHVISNGFDHEEISEETASKHPDKFLIKYIGSMTESAIPHNFFKALNSLSSKQRDKIGLQFFGSYNQKVHDTIRKYQLQDLVEFKGYVPHLQAKEEMRSADLLLLVIPLSKNNELILTGKLFDYIAAQKPIFCIGPKKGDAAAIIKEFNLGYCFDHKETEAMLTKLKHLLTTEKSDYQVWQKDYKLHPFSRFQLTKQLVQVISKNQS